MSPPEELGSLGSVISVSRAHPEGAELPCPSSQQELSPAAVLASLHGGGQTAGGIFPACGADSSVKQQ